MRYVGQGYELEVALPQDVHPGQLTELFARQYAAIFGKSFPDQPAEITHWKLTLSVAHADTEPRPLVPKSATGQALKGSRAAWDPVKQAMMPTPVYDRSWLAPGEPIQGPALIEDDASTCVMGPGDHARIDAYGNLVITVRPFGAPQ
jgi:N-methylhydantoinase A/oxoprolinase/acetone carboxylase beta subunit